jgi:glucuronate isomerase
VADLRADRHIEASELGLDLYRGIAELPIVSPHGHIAVRQFADTGARLDPPGRLFVTADHSVVRMLYRRECRSSASVVAPRIAPSGRCSLRTCTCSR